MGQTSITGVSVPDIDGYPNKKQDTTDRVYGPHDILFSDKKGTECQVIMVVQYKVPDYSSASRLSILLDRRLQINDGRCLKLHQHVLAKADTHIAYWEYPAYTLEREIRERRASSLSFVRLTQFFPDAEVWTMIRGLCKESVKFCTKMSRYHGDIQPKFIMLNAQGEVFLNDILTFQPLKETAYSRLLVEPGYVCCQGPQALENLEKSHQSPTFDGNKNDVFSIAISVMAAICDVPVGDDYLTRLYKKQGSKVSIDWPEIERLLRNQEDRGRSKDLVGALRIMLAKEEADRPSLYQVLEFIRLVSA